MSKAKGKTPKYSPEFKIMIIEDMVKNKLGYGETARKFGMYSSPERAFKRNGNKIPDGVTSTIKRWEQIYTTEGPERFYHHTHGRYRPENKLYQQVHRQDLLEENRLLKMDLDYLKKLDALVRKREQLEEKKQK